MLKINNIEYKIDEKYIDFGLFDGKVDDKKRKGETLYITLITNDFRLCIETVYDIKWLKGLKTNDVKDISKYIIGLPYEDDKGWMYLTDKCNCTINRIADNKYEFNLDGHFEECDQILNIEYEDILEI